MEKITSTSNAKIKELKKLKLNKYRKQNNLFLIETKHLIDEAIKNNNLLEIITTDINYQSDYPLTYVSDNVMKSLSSLQHSNYLGVVKIVDSNIDLTSNVIVLENIQDPGNLGTILRTALAFGWTNIILSDNSVDLYNEKVIQASQGAIFQMNIIRKEISNIVTDLKDNDYQLIGTALTNAKELNKQSKLVKKSALFFGNEGQGLSNLVLDNMDYNLFIPIKNIDSLNIGVAAGIIMYQLK